MNKGSILINSSKENFNDFFQNYLYGNYDDDDNIILSRGIWEDTFVKHPDIFQFAINFVLDKQWTGYSDSLGHDNVFSELEKFINLTSKDYTSENLGLTLGNVAGLNFVFQHLRKKYEKEGKELNLLTLKPFYPSILDSLSSLNNFDVDLIDSFNKEESLIYNNIEQLIEKGDYSSLLLPNLIGVDGRTFSSHFFEKVVELCEKKGIDFVIDETIWFNQLDYPENISSDSVIRLVSLSKMYGIPGMKIGYLVGSKDFIKEYYNTASSGYGGPASMFFLLQEFVYIFERNRLTGNDILMNDDLINIQERYGINDETINTFYTQYIDTIKENYNKFIENYNLIKKWYYENQDLFKNGSLNENNPAINTVFELDNIVDFKFFVSLIKLYKTSVFPGSCIGLDNNTLRINFLEDKEELKKGLNNISSLLEKYKKGISEDIKIVLFDIEKIIGESKQVIEEIFDTLKYKKIKTGIIGLNKDVSDFLDAFGLKVDFTLKSKGKKSENISKLLKNMLLIDDDLIYFRKNSQIGEGKDISNFLLMET